MVFSSFAVSSFFSRTLNSWFSAMVLSLLVLACADISRHLDRLRLVALGSRQEQSQYAIAVFGLDAVGIDLNRHRHGPIKPPGKPLPAMQRRLFRVADRLLARQSDGAAFHLHIEARLLHPRKLGDDDEVVALSEDIERRIGAAAAHTGIEPRARPVGVQSLLKARQRVERIQ